MLFVCRENQFSEKEKANSLVIMKLIEAGADPDYPGDKASITSLFKGEDDDGMILINISIPFLRLVISANGWLRYVINVTPG